MSGEGGRGDRSGLRLSMRPVGGDQLVPRTGGAWAVFGWAMIILAVAVVVLMIVFVSIYLADPGPPDGA